MTAPASKVLAPLLKTYDRFANCLSAVGDRWLIGLAARFVFAASLAGYFWSSASTKISEGLFGFLMPTVGAYAQILPKATEAVTYDVSQLGFFHHAIVYAGTYAEFILPALIILGLFTRFASLGMIGFIIVQSIVDVIGHGADATTIGALFDRAPDAVILDQRLFWCFLLAMLVIKGAGRLSLDALIAPKVR